MIPVGDFLRRRTTPYVNWTLIAINVAVFVYMLTLDQRPDRLVAGLATSEADRFLFDWGFVPACVTDMLGYDADVSASTLRQLCPEQPSRNWLQLLTAMFVHAGWAHIGGNMLFLWVFGDNIEDRLGHVKYLGFYLLCGFAASALQIAVAPSTDVPSVGASGAIAGVLGAYLLLYPTAMVQVVILPLFFLPFFLPAAVLIGFWFVMQLFAGFAELGDATAGSGVAWWAHVGGFIAGAALVLVLRGKNRQRFTQT
jgi:membrane associated rhomboid family serine protease